MQISTYIEYLAVKSEQDKIVNNLSDALNSLPKNELGLISDETRATSDYQSLKAQWNKEWRKLREIHQIGNKLFKQNIWEDMMESRNKRIIPVNN